MKTLRLSLKKKWFEMTKAGIKMEDYREINQYWTTRLRISYTFKQFDCNAMTLGYPSANDGERILILEHKGIEIRTGNPEWGSIIR